MLPSAVVADPAAILPEDTMPPLRHIAPLLLGLAWMGSACRPKASSQPTVTLDPPATPSWRLDPAEVVTLDDPALTALGLARTGHAGTGTPHEGSTFAWVSATNGSDTEGDGSETAPWRTVQAAADRVAPGTTVLVDASAPYEGGLVLERSGEEGAYIVFRNAVDGEMPQLLGDPEEESVVEIRASWVVVQGFRIGPHQGAGTEEDHWGIRVDTEGPDYRHIELRNNVIADIGPAGLEDGRCDYDSGAILVRARTGIVEDLVIDSNEVHSIYTGSSEVVAINGNVNGFVVTSNFVHDVNNIAIDVIGYEISDETTRQGFIDDNIVLDASNYWPYCSRGNCTYPEGDESGNGIYVDGGADLEIAWNVVGRADHGLELNSENRELIRDVEVHHNVVFNSNYRDYTLGPSEDIREHDNLFGPLSNFEADRYAYCP